MKLLVTVYFDEQERQFEIPIGMGDKSFKWLAMVASQRFSNAAPNGQLRRRENYCGISERTQHNAFSVELPDGTPILDPTITITDVIKRDEKTPGLMEEVIIRLTSKQTIAVANATPATTKWSTMAYSLSTNSLHSRNNENELGDHEDADDFSSFSDIEAKAVKGEEDVSVSSKAQAQFMRLILQSQIINVKACTHQFEAIWANIEKSIPSLNILDVPKIKLVFIQHWDLLRELYQHYAPNGFMDKAAFEMFMDEAEMFFVVDSASQIGKVYSRSCKYANVDGSRFDFGCLLVALLVCAQVKYNDTLSHLAGGVKKSYEALSDMFENNFLPLADQFRCRALVKSEFCSDYCMAKIRGLYNDLLALFNKYAFKSRDVAYTLPFEDVAEIFHKSELFDQPNDIASAKSYFQLVTKSGTIFGRERQLNPSDDFPTNEFAMPEFIEAAATAGFDKFYGKETKPGSDPDEGDLLSIAECLVKGVENVVDSVNAKPMIAASPTKGKGQKAAGAAKIAAATATTVKK